MRKLNSINIAWPLILALLTGCGMPGPLYQTPEVKANEASADSKKPEQPTQEKN